MNERLKAEMKQRVERIRLLVDSASQQVEVGNLSGVVLFAEYLEQQAASLRKEAVNAAH